MHRLSIAHLVISVHGENS